MRRLLLSLAAATLLCGPGPAPAAGPAGGEGRVDVSPTPGEGYYRVDGTAASVEGEILFRTDVEREACLARCGAFPGDAPRRDVPFAEARRLLVEDTAILHEQRRLSLGTVDEDALLRAAEEVRRNLAACTDPCRSILGEAVPAEYARRRLLVRDFLQRRVSAFVEVTDEEVARERASVASRRGTDAESVSPEEVRELLVAAKREKEIAEWRASAVSKARVVLPRAEEEP